MSRAVGGRTFDSSLDAYPPRDDALHLCPCVFVGGRDRDAAPANLVLQLGGYLLQDDLGVLRGIYRQLCSIRMWTKTVAMRGGHTLVLLLSCSWTSTAAVAAAARPVRLGYIL